MRRLMPILSFAILPLLTAGAGIHSGPMVGFAAMAEVLLWVQTDAPATVQVAYWEVGHPGQVSKTDPVQTVKKEGFIAKCIADQVRAGSRYEYRVMVDGIAVEVPFREAYRDGSIPMTFHTPPNWRFREDGHEPFPFTIGFGSCAYINEPEGGYDRMNGTPYGADYQIFESIYETRPDLFIWLGDNVYYREPDWSTRTGMIHRWTHDRSIPQLRPMLANIPQYAIWDDHDYGPNDIGREYWNKETATEVFNLFHGNPTAGLPETPGIFSYFAWGDVHFYLTDNRTYRTVRDLDPVPFGYRSQMLGKDQIDWLVELMKYNRNQSVSSYPCSFHVVAIGNQVISPYDKDGLRRFSTEWNYLFDRLVQEGIHNVIFLSGDVHFSEASKLVRNSPDNDPGGEFVFWDLTSSPMSAGPWPGTYVSENPYRVDIFPGERDRYGQRNYATLTFEGPLPERRAVVRYYDSDGNLLNQEPDGPEGQTTEASVIHARHLNLSPKLYP